MDPNASNYNPNYEYSSQGYGDGGVRGYDYQGHAQPEDAYYAEADTSYNYQGYDNEAYEWQKQHAEYEEVVGSSYGIVDALHHPALAPPGSYMRVAIWEPHVFGAPITALAMDTWYDKTLYVGTATTSASGGSGSNSSGIRHRHGGARQARLVIHELHASSASSSVYASVAGHPEAPASILNSIYQCVYGTKPGVATPVLSGGHHPGHGRTSSTSLRSPAALLMIPPHAFRPWYGTTNPALPDAALGHASVQLGITTLLPAPGGAVVSASPAGMRVHAHGGLLVADFYEEGLLTVTAQPGGGPDPAIFSHVVAGGMGLAAIDSMASPRASSSQIVCLDVWQGLRPVQRFSLGDATVAVTSLASSARRNVILAGGTGGQVCMMDARCRQAQAQLQSHRGGVVQVAVSPDDQLLATTGYGARPSSLSASSKARVEGSLYAFPDPNLYVYDLRYLGRGGIQHPFGGIKTGPRLVQFLPDTANQVPNRLIVGSGQAGGGLQILTPFEEMSGNAANFLVPSLEPGEVMSSLCASDDVLVIGTTGGRVHQYQMVDYKKGALSRPADRGMFVPSGNSKSGTTDPTANEISIQSNRILLPPLPSPIPEAPARSLDARLLLSDNRNLRLGMSEQEQSLFGAYVMVKDPILSVARDQYGSGSSFGPLMSAAWVDDPRMELSSEVSSKIVNGALSTLALQMKLLQKQGVRDQPVSVPSLNPNKLLYTKSLRATSFAKSFNRVSRGRPKRNQREDGAIDEDGLIELPREYRLLVRAGRSYFDHASHNVPGLLPGWDYPVTLPNSFVPPVLMLAYFIPELRESLKAMQFSQTSSNKESPALSKQAGFVFHWIHSIASNGLIYPATGSAPPHDRARLSAWSPSNFVSCLAAMREAEQLQILDGSPAAVAFPRRPEAFCRFLLYQSDKENAASKRVMDEIAGIDFLSHNEFLLRSGKAESTLTRAMTVELSYATLPTPATKTTSTTATAAHDTVVSFSTILQQTLCNERRLRAWNSATKSYETIVQRKIALSLPTCVILSCACAGRAVEEGLVHWRSATAWLPERMMIELLDDGTVHVREGCENGGKDGDGSGIWTDTSPSSVLPAAVCEAVWGMRIRGATAKREYRLESVLSYIRDDQDRACPLPPSSRDDEPSGHHVLHARMTAAFTRDTLQRQADRVDEVMSQDMGVVASTLVHAQRDKEQLAARQRLTRSQLAGIVADANEWLLFNGYGVQSVNASHARDFHATYRDPCLVLFRAVDDPNNCAAPDMSSLLSSPTTPSDLMHTTSLAVHAPPHLVTRISPTTRWPGRGDVIALDAEFVALQDETAVVTDTGAKVVVRDTRYALARISAIWADNDERLVLLDDYVRPDEPVVDYLTRFSGIVPRDLDPKHSTRHLISTAAAYHKLRWLAETCGCVFVGHGLHSDFMTANLYVSPTQIVDTVELYHKPAQRYVSLRFLTNFVLHRDMQRDTHDSLEDAAAALDLYEQYVTLQQEPGQLAKLLDELYEHGERVDWKLGMA